MTKDRVDKQGYKEQLGRTQDSEQWRKNGNTLIISSGYYKLFSRILLVWASYAYHLHILSEMVIANIFVWDIKNLIFPIIKYSHDSEGRGMCFST